MQLDFLQKDLFSEVLEPLSPSPKKTKAKASNPQAPELDLPEAPQPVVAAPRHEPEVIAAQTSASASQEDEEITQEHFAQEADEVDEPGEKAPGAFKTISEVAGFLGLPQHVLRFWESRFSQIKPLKMRGGRRYYRPEDIEILSTIKHLLYKQGYTINGAKKAFSQGKNALVEQVQMETMVAVPPVLADKPKISEKQKSQLTAIRQELYALRETLKPYMEEFRV